MNKKQLPYQFSPKTKLRQCHKKHKKTTGYMSFSQHAPAALYV